MDLFLYALGGLLISALVLWWRPEVGRRAAIGYLLAAGVFFGVPLATASLQVGSDIPYVWRPWLETVPEAERVNRPLNPLLGDIPLQLLPYRALVRERLLDLEAPLWIHEVGTGAPLLGNGYSAPFSPLHLLALPLPAERSITVTVAWQTLLALLLTHALLLGLGARRAGAALAALAYSFSAFQVVWAYHPHAMTAAWLPGVLLAMVLLRRGERGAFAALVTCGLGMALSGHPETLAHGALACAAVFGALLARRKGVPRGAFAGRLAVAAVLTGCLAAPVLLPILEVLPHSERWQVVERLPDSVDPPPFRAAFLLLPVQPLLYGSPRDDNWAEDGPANFNELCSGYAGLLTLAVAVAGAFAASAGERRRRLLLLAGGLFALLASMGVEPFFWLVDSLPGLSHGAHARLRLLWILAVAVAAGLGLGDLVRERRGVWAGLAALAATALVLLLVPAPPVVWQRVWWIATVAGTALAAATLALPRLRPIFPAVAVAVLGLDLALLLVRYHPTVPGSFDLAAPPALAHVVEAAGQEGPFRVMAEGNDLKPDLGLLYGLWDPRGYDPMRPADAALVAGRGFLPRFKVGRELRLESRRFPNHAQRMFDYLGVRYILTRHQRRVPPPWEPAWNDAGGKVWRNPRALPLFFFPASARRVPDPAEALDLALATRDYAAFGVTHGAAPAGPRPQTGEVRILEVLPNGFALEVETATGGLVVSSVADARGWRLESVEGAGKPTLRRVNGGFVGFEIGPGRHRVRLDYRPAGWTWGLWMAGAGVLGMALLLIPQHLDRLPLQRPHARQHPGGHGE